MKVLNILAIYFVLVVLSTIVMPWSLFQIPGLGNYEINYGHSTNVLPGILPVIIPLILILANIKKPMSGFRAWVILAISIIFLITTYRMYTKHLGETYFINQMGIFVSLTGYAGLIIVAFIGSIFHKHLHRW